MLALTRLAISICVSIVIAVKVVFSEAMISFIPYVCFFFIWQDSGLSIWLADQMSVLSSIHPWAMVIIICIVVSLSTEVTTNTAICTIYMPILAELVCIVFVFPKSEPELKN